MRTLREGRSRGFDCHVRDSSRSERRDKILQIPFPPGWSEILERNVPIYGRLPELDQAELRGLIQVFLAEKVFEGCGGLEITDEIRVTIAAQACMLLLHRETDVYPKLITILVYPTAYVSNMPQHSPQGIVTEGPQGRLGEAWTSGVVVLSWDDVKLGAADVRDGHNVVFHEFAHQLDQEDGSADGAPILPRRNMYSAWARVLGAEYAELRKAAETGKKSVLDNYGATEPAEFFAVATEAFFEKPVQLKKKHPELYEELQDYYGQDPEADFSPVPRRGQAVSAVGAGESPASHGDVEQLDPAVARGGCHSGLRSTRLDVFAPSVVGSAVMSSWLSYPQWRGAQALDPTDRPPAGDVACSRSASECRLHRGPVVSAMPSGIACEDGVYGSTWADTSARAGNSTPSGRRSSAGRSWPGSSWRARARLDDGTGRARLGLDRLGVSGLPFNGRINLLDPTLTVRVELRPS